MNENLVIRHAVRIIAETQRLAVAELEHQAVRIRTIWLDCVRDDVQRRKQLYTNDIGVSAEALARDVVGVEMGRLGLAPNDVLSLEGAVRVAATSPQLPLGAYVLSIVLHGQNYDWRAAVRGIVDEVLRARA